MIKNFVKKIYARVPGKASVFHMLRSRVTLPEHVYRHLHFEGRFTVELPQGGRFSMFHFGNQVENDLFWAGYGNGWERTSLRLWEALARQSRTIFDVGANTGTFALAAKAASPHAHVEAFEPVARVFDKLSANAKLNEPTIKTNCIALSDRTGSATLFDSGDSHVYSASLNEAMLGAAGDRAKSVVPVQTLDDFCRQHSIAKIDLIKIDTEMHESEVIDGAQAVLARDRPAVLIEILNADLGAKVAELMRGYRFYEIREGEGIVRTATPGSAGEWNYLALHVDDPRAGQLGDGMSERDLCVMV